MIQSEGLAFVNAAPPEMQVWAAVLRQAVIDLGVSGKKRGALAWLQSHMDGPGSLLFVCNVLDVEPGYVRRLAMQRGPPSMAAENRLTSWGKSFCSVPRSGMRMQT